MIEKASVQVTGKEENERENFYCELHDLNSVASSLSRAGLSRSALMNTESLAVLPPELITKGLIVDLEYFRKKEKLTHAYMAMTLEKLLGKPPGSLNTLKVMKAVKVVISKYQNLKKSKQPSVVAMLHSFVCEPFTLAGQNMSQVPGEACMNSLVSQSSGSTHENCDGQSNVLSTGNSNDFICTESASTHDNVHSSETEPCIICVSCDPAKSCSCEHSKSGASASPQCPVTAESGICDEPSAITATVNRQLEEKQIEISKMKEDIHLLKEICKEKEKTIFESTKIIEMKENICKKLNDKIDNLERKCEKKKHVFTDFLKLKKEHSCVQQSAYYKRLKRKENKLQKKEKILHDHETGGCKEQLSSLKKQIKTLQTQLSKHKNLLVLLKSEKSDLEKECINIKQMLDDMQCQLDEIKHKGDNISTRIGTSGKFNEDIKKCVIGLLGEAEVSASQCSKVIQIVCQNLFHKNVSLSELPSERTVIRYADQGHFLAKYHIGERLLNSSAWDLHSDGTSKDRKKSVGHQATLDCGETLSLGFTSVASEDTSTLVDVAVSTLKEISDIYDCNSESAFKDIMSHLVGLMSDRASVMKSFDKALEKERQSILGTTAEDRLQFLHCNAHFLLGLSNMCEKIMSGIEEAIRPLGRDRLPVFKRFGSSCETATSRYIRTASDCLGPRGDEKSGCREDWLAFCTKSKISSYRSNRFNNYFQGAAALTHHRKEIIDMLTNYCTNLNLKLKSVLEDSKCEKIADLIRALGIIYYSVTGPYWLLVQSQVKYLHFHKYVQEMHHNLVNWSTDATPLLSGRNISSIPQFALNVEDDCVFQSLCCQSDQVNTFLKESLQKLCAGIVIVIERQLVDFLPNGKYSEVADEALEQKMAHCKLTNLIGEACFGDLDFSFYKRRHTSLHHHSTINMLKRNRTMTSWFDKKSFAQQSQLLSMASKDASVLRASHNEANKQVVETTKRKLEAQKALIEKKHETAVKKKRDILDQVKELNGPCHSASDVDSLLSRVKGKGNQLKAIKAEIQYHKVVLGVNKKELKVTGTLDTLVSLLKSYLESIESDHEYDFNVENQASVSAENTITTGAASNESSPRPSSADFEDSETDFVELNIDEPPCKIAKLNDKDDSDNRFFNFKFERQGIYVSVYYDDGYYIGEVVKVLSDDEAEVSFMQMCKVKEGLLRWPSSVDRDIVSAIFVLTSNFDLSSENGRTWQIANSEIERMNKLYDQYKFMYCM